MSRALIFDCDGVLADTERHGHLVAFNRLFSEEGLGVQWSPEQYADLLAIAGGKERLLSLFADRDWVTRHGLPGDPEEQTRLVATWHRRKTDIFLRLVAEGRVPARPGIARLATEARAAGWQVAVASTATDESVRSIVAHALPPEIAGAVRVFAGDIVEHKKPAPNLYLLVLSELGLGPGEVCVVEDSQQGLRASLGASCPTIITVSDFTAGEDFTGAALVVDSLGDDSHPVQVLETVFPEPPRGVISLETVEAVIEWHRRALPPDRTARPVSPPGNGP